LNNMIPYDLLVGRNRAIDRERLYGVRPPIRVGYLMKKFSAFITLFKPKNPRLLSPANLFLKNRILQISDDPTFPLLFFGK